MENTKETFRGTIIFLPDKIGSKSEAVYPFLYVNRDTCFKVLLKNDNPFENRGLVPFDGKLVEIVGALGRRTFVVETVRAVASADGAQEAAVADATAAVTDIESK